MWKIIKLDKNLANQISAWEVVERPVSAIKELVENSIDAWSTNIKVEITGGWKEEFSISDNGSGIEKEDLPLTIEKYTTSKIKNLNDLYNVLTFWFRWEALASIASVSRLTIISKHIDSDIWYKMEVEGWDIVEISEFPSEVWTKIIVKDLFFNTPARLNYLKTDKTESGHISEFLNAMALSYPNVWFEFVNEWKTSFKFDKDESLPIRIYNVYWESFFEKLTDLECEVYWIKISGFISKPDSFFPNKNRQVLFINNRVIKNPTIFRAIQNAYNRYIPNNMNPGYILKIALDPTEVDVNVHPRKMEVRFANEQEIFKAVYSAVNKKLESDTLVETSESYEWDSNKVWDSFPSPSIGISWRTENFSSPSLSQNRDTSIPKEPSYYSSGSWTKFKSYSPYKDIKFNPAQTDITSGIEFTKELLSNENSNTKNEEFGKSTDLHDTPLWKIIGQIFYSYIVVETKEWMKILDQHALAERILYEKLVANAPDIQTQGLLLAVSFNITPNEYSIICENEEELRKVWFDFELMWEKSVIVSGIPNFVKEWRIEESFLGSIKDIWEENARKIKTIDEVYNKVFATIACRSSIKFWDKLNLFQMNKLLNDASKYYCSTCPHWRSVEFKIDLNELKSKFDR